MPTSVNNNTPLVSVIVPVYKVEKYLRACLESICSQTYKHLDIIIVNDASPDRSAEIITEFATRDARIQSFTHEKNKGVSAARNLGIAHARGAYLMFMDSDDDLDLDYIATLVPIALRYDLDLLLGAVIGYDDGAREKPYSVPYMQPTWQGVAKVEGALSRIDDFQNALRKYPRLLTWCIPVGPPAKLFKRGILDPTIFVSHIRFEDEATFPEILFRIKNIAYYNDQKSWLWYRCNHGSSFMSSRNASVKAAEDMIVTTEHITKSFKTHAPELLYYALEKNIYFLQNRLINLDMKADGYIGAVEKLGAYLLEMVREMSPADMDKIRHIDPAPIRYVYAHLDSLNAMQTALVFLRYHIEVQKNGAFSAEEIKEALHSWVAEKTKPYDLSTYSSVKRKLLMLYLIPCNMCKDFIKRKILRSA